MKSNKCKLYKNVDNFRTEYGFSIYDSIDTLLLVEYSERVDLEYLDFKTPGLCGLAMVGESKDTIVLNSNRTRTEQRFDCGHELMHLYLHRHLESNFNCFTTQKSNQNSFLEWQANEGAAQLLVPFQDFIPRFFHLFSYSRFTTDYDIRNILADHYHVTFQVIYNRIDCLSYEIDQFATGCPISEIQLLSRNQRMRMNILPTAYNAECDFPFRENTFITG